MWTRRLFGTLAFSPGAALLLLLLGGCAFFGGGSRESPEVVRLREVEDTRIRTEVEARLAAEPSVRSGQVRVEVRAGEVELHGAVFGFGALQCALRNAGLTPGVRLVIDMLVLESGPADVQCLAPRVFGAIPVVAAS